MGEPYTDGEQGVEEGNDDQEGEEAFKKVEPQKRKTNTNPQVKIS